MTDRGGLADLHGGHVSVFSELTGSFARKTVISLFPVTVALKS